MPAISTRDEALAAVGAALAQWTAASGDVLARATAAVRGVRAETEAELSRRARRVAELASLLGSLRADDPRRAAVAYDLARAQADQHAAVQAATRVTGLMERAAALQRSHARNTRSFTEAARADLTRREGQLGAYRAAGAGGLGGGFAGTPHALGGLALGGAAVGGAATGGSAAGGGTGPGWLTSAGLADVSVAEAGFADNPIVGEFGRDGLTRADYRWAVTQWDEVIRPGLDRGMTRDDFAAKDAARDAPPLRRLAFVYDIFLGSEAIVVNRLPDGTIDVTNGRHRLTVARELGVTSLPARWVR
jgi:hypothetical protein